MLSLLLAAVLLGLLPASALGANTTPRVHVTVENTTYTEANAASDWIAPAWSGQLLSVWVPLEGTMTMMSCIDSALESLGYPTIGADKGGAVNAFDDFDIDYNQMKYLIETRCSGALTKPFSAIVVESTAA